MVAVGGIRRPVVDHGQVVRHLGDDPRSSSGSSQRSGFMDTSMAPMSSGDAAVESLSPVMFAA